MKNPQTGSALHPRRWQQGALITLSLAVAVFMVSGLYSLCAAPVLILGPQLPYSLSESDIQSIADTKLDAAFRRHLPEFFTPTAEAKWWQLHEQVYNLLRTQRVTSVTVTDRLGRARTEQVWVESLSLMEALNRTWLIYLVAFIYVISALSILQRHPSSPGSILAFFFVACALYFTLAAPVVSRPLTLPPLVFQVFIAALHTAAGGLITLVHFAFVFPEPKPLVQRYPWLFSALYGYYGLTTILYLSGLTAFGTTFPFFLFWLAVVVGAFLHSFLKEKNPFLKKQVGLSLLAPILACLFFTCFLLPGVLGVPQIRFTYFALFSLILPFALPLAMDNRALYQEQLALELNTQQEKERLREELHDIVLNNLALLSLSAEVSLTQPEGDLTTARERLQRTRDVATETALQLRGFLQLSDDNRNTWEELCNTLRRWGSEWVEPFGMTFEFNVSQYVLELPTPPLRLRVCLHRVYREALVNVIKHAQATIVKGALFRRGDTVFCEIRDDGVGFVPDGEADGHYGLRNMERRVTRLGGTLRINSKEGEGTYVTVQLPIR